MTSNWQLVGLPATLDVSRQDERGSSNSVPDTEAGISEACVVSVGNDVHVTSTRNRTDVRGGFVGDERRPFGFNIIGYVSGNLGLGVSARNVTSLLLSLGFPIAILDMDPGKGRGGHDLRFDEYKVASPDRLPYGINLVILDLQALPNFFLRPPWMLEMNDSLHSGHFYWNSPGQLNAAVLWWEVSVLPRRFVKALEIFDVVLGPSPFLSAVLENHLSSVPTVPLAHPFHLPDNVQSDRSYHELPDDVILFVTSFEPFSIAERKNPVAVVDAFQKAFPSDTGVRLIVKLNNAGAVGDYSQVLRPLRERCNADARIQFMDKTLNYHDVLSLYASCDVLVSLHRAEGLGFGLMEAMALGKPVIATGWSGNMAFMDHTNSCLVAYRLVPVPEASRVYGRKQLGEIANWAEPDLECAAAWMKKLVEDPVLRIALGTKAAKSMVQFQQRAKEAKFVHELQAIWQNSTFLPDSRKARKAELLRALEQAVEERSESSLSFRTRWSRRIKNAADRHVTWRFGKKTRDHM